MSRREDILFDHPIPFEAGNGPFCAFELMQLSHDAHTLYLVGSVYATSGSLAIISLPKGPIKYVPGVNEVYVIQTGTHRDELIYVLRVYHKSANAGEYPAYPFIHARADGQPIREVSNEWGGQGNMPHDKMPLLRNYLRRIGGTISVNGETLPLGSGFRAALKRGIQVGGLEVGFGATRPCPLPAAMRSS